VSVDVTVNGDVDDVVDVDVDRDGEGEADGLRPVKSNEQPSVGGVTAETKVPEIRPLPSAVPFIVN
jgi:hypothetical protein